MSLISYGCPWRNVRLLQSFFSKPDNIVRLSTKVASVRSVKPEKKDVKVKRKKPIKIKNQKTYELLQYIQEQDKVASDNISNKESASSASGSPVAQLSESLPKRFVRVTRSAPESAYLIDESVAEILSREIKNQQLDRNAPVLEINPGPGLLTAKLKNKLCFKNITCFEDDPKLKEALKTELGVNVVSTNVLGFSRLHHLDKIDAGGRVSAFLDQIQTNSDENFESNKDLYIFGAIPSLSFINFTIKTLVTQRVFYEDEFNWSNPIYFVTLGARAYWILTSNPHSGYFPYRPSAILFQLLFEYKHIKQLPRNAFIPWEKEFVKTSAKFKLKNDYNPDVIQFVKIQTNTKTLKTLGKDHLVPFWFFIRHHLFSRRRPIIPQLERWIPGCGPRLIRQGFTIYTQFGELTPEQILDIYMQFISWPEFPSCSYLSAVDKYFSRVDIGEEGTF